MTDEILAASGPGLRPADATDAAANAAAEASLTAEAAAATKATVTAEAAAGHSSRLGRFWRGVWRGRPQDPGWVRPALLALLLGTALLYLVGLGRSGWANAF